MFTKADLKNGDFVKYRNGDIRLVVDGILYGDKQFGCLSAFCDDLTVRECDSSMDIVAVYRQNYTFASATAGYCVFDRYRDCKPKVEEMTLSEICEALGKEIKIIKEH